MEFPVEVLGAVGFEEGDLLCSVEGQRVGRMRVHYRKGSVCRERGLWIAVGVSACGCARIVVCVEWEGWREKRCSVEWDLVMGKED